MGNEELNVTILKSKVIYYMRVPQLLLFLFLSSSSFSQKDSLILIGTLQEDVPRVVDCGIAIVSTYGKVKIENYSDSTYRKNEIIVLFTCPSQLDLKELTNGKKLVIKLSNDANSSFGNPIKNTIMLEHFEQIKNFNGGSIVWAIEWKVL